MNWKELFELEWKRISLTGFLAVLFLILDRMLLAGLTFKEAFYAVLVYFIVNLALYFFLFFGLPLSTYINFIKKGIAFISLLIAVIAYFLVFKLNFIFILVPYGAVSFLISCLIMWELKSRFKEIYEMMDDKLFKIFWVIVMGIALFLFIYISMMVGG